MHDYNTILGVIELRLSKVSYDAVQKRYRIGRSGIALIMNRYNDSGLSLDDLRQMPPAKHQFNRSDFVKWVENCASWIEGDRDIVFSDIGDFWISLITVNGATYLTDEEKLIIRERLYKILVESKVYEKSLTQWFDYVRKALCFDKYLEQNTYFQDEKDNIDNLVKEMSGSEYKEYGIDKFSKIGKPENQIVISTRHSSKGLEFEAIVMMGMEEDHFPSYYAKNDSRLLAEANRLCFVCVSRAKRVCVLMRSNYYTIDTKNGPWRKMFYPSRYWKQLYSKYGKDR